MTTLRTLFAVVTASVATLTTFAVDGQAQTRRLQDSCDQICFKSPNARCYQACFNADGGRSVSKPKAPREQPVNAVDNDWRQIVLQAGGTGRGGNSGGGNSGGGGGGKGK
jgi:hypothetical protein